MKKYSFIIVIFIGLTLAGPALAHQPRIVSDTPGQITEIINPEISQAFYGELTGTPQVFRITASTGFELYVGILEPKIISAQKKMSAQIFRLGSNLKSEVLVASLDGIGFEWKEFFEPFGGDTYWQGPEFKSITSAGTYIIRVYNPGNTGKYSLAIGAKESFPPLEMVRTLIVLPVLKTWFFERSILLSYWNYSGLFVLLLLIIIGVTVWSGRKIYIKYKKK